MSQNLQPGSQNNVTDQAIIRQACEEGGGLDQIHARSEVQLGRRLKFEDLLLVSTILAHPRQR